MDFIPTNFDWESHAKITGMVSPYYFGARGSSIYENYDDTDAFEAAMDYCYWQNGKLNRGYIELGSGSFGIDPTRGIQMKDNIVLKSSAGWGGAEIFAVNNSPGSLIKKFGGDDPVRSQYWQVVDIRFVFSGDDQIAVDARWAGRAQILRPRFTQQRREDQADGTGERLNLPQTIYPGTIGILIDAVTPPGGDGVYVGGGQCLANKVDRAIVIEGGSSHRIENFEATSCNEPIYLSQDSYNCIIDLPRLQYWDRSKYAIDCHGDGHVIRTGGFFESNSGVSSNVTAIRFSSASRNCRVEPCRFNLYADSPGVKTNVLNLGNNNTIL